MKGAHSTLGLSVLLLAVTASLGAEPPNPLSLIKIQEFDVQKGEKIKSDNPLIELPGAATLLRLLDIRDKLIQKNADEAALLENFKTLLPKNPPRIVSQAAMT